MDGWNFRSNSITISDRKRNDNRLNVTSTLKRTRVCLNDSQRKLLVLWKRIWNALLVSDNRKKFHRLVALKIGSLNEYISASRVRNDFAHEDIRYVSLSLDILIHGVSLSPLLKA